MKKQMMKFKSVFVSAIQQLRPIMVAIVAAMVLISSAWGQAASRTSMERVGSTNLYNLVFHQDNNDPWSLSGVEYYVVVSGTSPSISLSVPASSWLFDAGETSIDIGSPEVSGSTYRFPVTVWRDDNEPQDGDGLYLAVTVTDGLGICVEDFPGKAFPGAPQPAPSAVSLEELLRQAAAIRLHNLDGVELLRATGEGLVSVFKSAWSRMGSGVYFLSATMSDSRTTNLKLMR